MLVKEKIPDQLETKLRLSERHFYIYVNQPSRKKVVVSTEMDIDPPIPIYVSNPCIFPQKSQRINEIYCS